jgi:CDP-paratose 2-epimerase
VYGDGKQVRDILYVEDLVDALTTAADQADRLAGTAFNIGGGPGNAVSLLDVLDAIAELSGEPPQLDVAAWRAGDQRYYVSDVSAFGRATGWAPRTRWTDGVAHLHDWLSARRGAARAAA